MSEFRYYQLHAAALDPRTYVYTNTAAQLVLPRIALEGPQSDAYHCPDGDIEAYTCLVDTDFALRGSQIAARDGC